MKLIETPHPNGSALCHLAKARMETRNDRLFLADWDRVLMMHFAVDARRLQAETPFELDLHDGQAFVTLVAFTMSRMRLAFGGGLTSWIFRPMITHDFLNVRTYVRVGEAVGIHFLAEWVSNRIAVALGPRTFSLPYRHGRIDYHNDWRHGQISGQVEDVRSDTRFAYQAELDPPGDFSECTSGTLDEWLMERYNAFNSACNRQRFFRVWHEPWQQSSARVNLADVSLLEANWKWFVEAEFVGANYSPGVQEVWLGRPHRIKNSCRS